MCSNEAASLVFLKSYVSICHLGDGSALCHLSVRRSFFFFHFAIDHILLVPRRKSINKSRKRYHKKLQTSINWFRLAAGSTSLNQIMINEPNVGPIAIKTAIATKTCLCDRHIFHESIAKYPIEKWKIYGSYFNFYWPQCFSGLLFWTTTTRRKKTNNRTSTNWRHLSYLPNAT